MILPVLLTLGLSSNLAAALARILPGPLKGVFRSIEGAYYPLLILACLAALFYLESGKNSGEQTRAVTGEARGPQGEFASQVQS